MVALAGCPLIGAQSGALPVAAAYRSWHSRQVFHGAPRPAAMGKSPVTLELMTGRSANAWSMVACMASKKVTVTIPEDLLDEIRAEASERGLSAYVAEALRAKRDRDRLVELVSWLEEEHGPVTEDEHSASLNELNRLDAEHAHRRPGSTGEAA